MASPTEDDLRVAEELLLACCPEKGRGNGILSVDGELTILLGRAIQKAAASAIAAEREKAAKSECLIASCKEPQSHFCFTHSVEVFGTLAPTFAKLEKDS